MVKSPELAIVEQMVELIELIKNLRLILHPYVLNKSGGGLNGTRLLAQRS